MFMLGVYRSAGVEYSILNSELGTRHPELPGAHVPGFAFRTEERHATPRRSHHLPVPGPAGGADRGLGPGDGAAEPALPARGPAEGPGSPGDGGQDAGGDGARI